MHRYVSFSFDVDRGFDMHEITAMLPPLLQQEVFLNVHAPLLRKVPMFEGCDDVFINQLVRVLRPQVLLKGDLVRTLTLTLNLALTLTLALTLSPNPNPNLRVLAAGRSQP